MLCLRWCALRLSNWVDYLSLYVQNKYCYYRLLMGFTARGNWVCVGIWRSGLHRGPPYWPPHLAKAIRHDEVVQLLDRPMAHHILVLSLAQYPRSYAH
jgi:hypothetical protein